MLPLGIAMTGVWAAVLLRRTPSWHPWLAWTVAGSALVAALGLLAVRLGWVRVAGLAAVAAVAGLVAGLAGPAAYAASAAGGRTEGGNPMAGPASGRMGFPGGGRMPGGSRMPARIREMIAEGRMPGFPGGGFPGGRGEAGGVPGGPGGAGAGNGFPGAGGAGPGGTQEAPGGQSGAKGATGGQSGSAGARQGGGMGFGGRMGGVGSAMLSYLEKNRAGATWLVAVSNSQAAASVILQTGQPAISMFGFVGGDNAMTVQRLRQLVKAGKLHYVLAGGGGPGGGFGRGGGNSAAVTSWVTKNCTAVKASDYGASSTSAQGGASLYRCG